jgi:SAM-dependent methyltransferase
MDYGSQQFYDSESDQYSKKRYEGLLSTYTQFLFRKRLEIFLGMFKQIAGQRKVSLLDIGCADGIVINRIQRAFPQSTHKVVGIDISPQMIAQARESIKDPRASFYLRNEAPQEMYGVILELGVHVENLEDEIQYVKNHLVNGGYFIYSVAGRDSLHARIKLQNAAYVKDYRSYADAERILSEHFEIVDSQAYGFFIPKLWSIPPLARVLQPIIDSILRGITPSLFHEKIYLLRDKRST